MRSDKYLKNIVKLDTQYNMDSYLINPIQCTVCGIQYHHIEYPSCLYNSYHSWSSFSSRSVVKQEFTTTALDSIQKQINDLAKRVEKAEKYATERELRVIESLNDELSYVYNKLDESERRSDKYKIALKRTEDRYEIGTECRQDNGTWKRVQWVDIYEDGLGIEADYKDRVYMSYKAGDIIMRSRLEEEQAANKLLREEIAELKLMSTLRNSYCTKNYYHTSANCSCEFCAAIGESSSEDEDSDYDDMPPLERVPTMATNISKHANRVPTPTFQYDEHNPAPVESESHPLVEDEENVAAQSQQSFVSLVEEIAGPLMNKDLSELNFSDLVANITSKVETKVEGGVIDPSQLLGEANQLFGPGTEGLNLLEQMGQIFAGVLNTPEKSDAGAEDEESDENVDEESDAEADEESEDSDSSEFVVVDDDSENTPLLDH